MQQCWRRAIILLAPDASQQEITFARAFASYFAQECDFLYGDPACTLQNLAREQLPDVLIVKQRSDFALAQSLGLAAMAFEFPCWEGSQPQQKSSTMADHILKIAILGPESTGKSTLCRELSHHFQAPFVAEYARIYCENKPQPLNVGDVLAIAHGHAALESAVTQIASTLIFIDTDAIMTKLYASIYYGFSDPWLEGRARDHSYDLYLLLAPDVPWISDPARDLPHMRAEFFARCRDELVKYQRNFVVIDGAFTTRFNKARQAIEEFKMRPIK